MMDCISIPDCTTQGIPRLKIGVTDVIFLRNGQPAQVTAQDPKTGRVKLDNNFSQVQEHNPYGIRNGLDPEHKKAFIGVLNNVKNDDKKQEITDLFDRIQDMKKNNAPATLVQYLENELAFRMTQTHFEPPRYDYDPKGLNPL